MFRDGVRGAIAVGCDDIDGFDRERWFERSVSIRQETLRHTPVSKRKPE